MIEEAMRWIAGHVQPTTVATTKAGRVVVALGPDQQLVTKDTEERVKPLELHSLTSLVEWSRDHQGAARDPALYALVVESPTKVAAVSTRQIEGHEVLAFATVKAPGLPTGTHDLPEARNILLSCANTEAHELAALLSQVRHVVATESEDALAQKVTLSSGVATVSQHTLPVEHVLAPPSTFAEIEPVAIRYAVRLRTTGERFVVAFHPLDQVLWVEETRKRIRGFLAEQKLEHVRVL